MKIFFLFIQIITSYAYITSWGSKQGCYILLAQKLRQRSFLVDKKVSVRSLYDCKRECDITFIGCNSFSYNTNIHNQFNDNCLLSKRQPETLDLREGADLTYDRDFVFYGKFPEEKCRLTYLNLNSSPMSGRTIDRGVAASTTYMGHCFRLARRGVRIADQYIKQRLRVLTVTDCEKSCLEAPFICRGFNFKFKVNAGSLLTENCELSIQDTYRINLNDKLMFLDHYDYDFYERTSFSNECSRYNTFQSRMGDWLIPHSRMDHQFPFGIQNTNHRLNPFIPTFGHHNINQCFTMHKRYMRPHMRLFGQKYSVNTLEECKRKCMEHHNCQSFAYTFGTNHGRGLYGNNCFLYEYSVDQMDARKELMYDKEFDMYQRQHTYGCYGNKFGSNSLYPISNLITGESRANPYSPAGGFETVSGLRCLRDKCREDVNGRYYYCDTDTNGAWDYCCRPDEACQTHRDSAISWCHVGTKGRSQWRPCKTTSTFRRAYLVDNKPNVTLLAIPDKDKVQTYKGTHPIELNDLEFLTKSKKT